MQKIGAAVAFIWDWTARICVALLGLLALVAGVTVVVTEVWFLSPILLFVGIYFAFTPFAPDSSAAAMKWLGRQLSRPYNRLFVPYVAEPVEAGAEVAGRVAEGLVVLVFKISLWVLGIALAIFLSWLSFKGIAALPVSVAVIIGAFIIAGALRSNGRE